VTPENKNNGKQTHQNLPAVTQWATAPGERLAHREDYTKTSPQRRCVYTPPPSLPPRDNNKVTHLVPQANQRARSPRLARATCTRTAHEHTHTTKMARCLQQQQRWPIHRRIKLAQALSLSIINPPSLPPRHNLRQAAQKTRYTHGWCIKDNVSRCTHFPDQNASRVNL